MTTHRRYSRNTPAVFVLGLLLAVSAAGEPQRYHLQNYNGESPEGSLIDLIQLTDDQARKITLIEQFVARYPKHAAAPWASEQLQWAYYQAKEYDKAIAAGERILALFPDDLETAQLNLQAAQAKRDSVLVRLWTDAVQAIARRLASAPPPKEGLTQEDWKKRLDAASQVTAQQEYAAYKKAVDASDQKTRLRYLDDLLKQYPATQYLPQAQALYFQAYRVLGEHGKAFEMAQKILESDSQNEDALLIMAQANSARQADSTIPWAQKVIEVLSKKAKPAAVPEVEWERKKAYYMGSAYWMMGNVHFARQRWGAADQTLRAALPLLHGGESAATVLFYLGWTNYKLENFTDSLRFYQQCAAMNSQYTGQALKNISVIKTERNIQD